MGRNLNGHTYTGAVGFFEQEIYDDIGPGVCISVCDYNHGTPGLAGGGMLANEFIRLPYPVLGRPAAGHAVVGQGPQGLHAPLLPAQHHRSQGPTQDMPDLGRPRRSSTRR